MFGDEILGAIKGIGEVVLKGIDEFTMSSEEKLEFKLKMQQAIFEANRSAMELTYRDLESARKRESETGDKTTRQLAWLYTGGYFGIFVVLISGVFNVEEGIKQLIDVLMAVLTAGQYSILAYYFGSSHGSQAKDKTLDRAVNAATKP